MPGSALGGAQEEYELGPALRDGIVVGAGEEQGRRVRRDLEGPRVERVVRVEAADAACIAASACANSSSVPVSTRRYFRTKAATPRCWSHSATILQVSFRRRFGGNGLVNVAYTLSRLKDACAGSDDHDGPTDTGLRPQAGEHLITRVAPGHGSWDQMTAIARPEVATECIPARGSTSGLQGAAG